MPSQTEICEFDPRSSAKYSSFIFSSRVRARGRFSHGKGGYIRAANMGYFFADFGIAMGMFFTDFGIRSFL